MASVHSYFLGGLAAVIYTDAAQTVIMLIGALTLMGFSMYFPFSLIHQLCMTCHVLLGYLINKQMKFCSVSFSYLTSVFFPVTLAYGEVLWRSGAGRPF